MSNTRKAGPVTDDLRLYDMGEGGSLFLYNAGQKHSLGTLCRDLPALTEFTV